MLALAFVATMAANLDENDTSLLTSMVTASLTKVQALDVISGEDVKRQLSLEAERQTLGCSNDASCIAEVTGALGARLAVYGQAGELDDKSVVLTLNLFDSQTASAAGRVVVQGKSVSALANQIDKAAQDLVADFVAKNPVAPGGQRTRVIVLDLAAPKHVAMNEERVGQLMHLESELTAAKQGYWSGTPWLLAGLGVGIGGLALGVGYGIDQSLKGADDHWSLIGCGIGGVATFGALEIAAGITTVTNHFIEEDIAAKERAIDDFKKGKTSPSASQDRASQVDLATLQ